MLDTPAQPLTILPSAQPTKQLAEQPGQPPIPQPARPRRVSPYGELIRSSSETLNVGRELREWLERIARQEGFDATGLARRLLREACEAREQAAKG